MSGPVGTIFHRVPPTGGIHGGVCEHGRDKFGPLPGQASLKLPDRLGAEHWDAWQHKWLLGRLCNTRHVPYGDSGIHILVGSQERYHLLTLNLSTEVKRFPIRITKVLNDHAQMLLEYLFRLLKLLLGSVG